MQTFKSWVIPAIALPFLFLSDAPNAEPVGPLTVSPTLQLAQAEIGTPAIIEPENLSQPEIDPIPETELDPLARAEKAVEDARAALREQMATGGDVRGARRHLQAMIKELDKIRKDEERQAKKDKKKDKKKKKKKKDSEGTESAETTVAEAPAAELPQLAAPRIVLPQVELPQPPTLETPTPAPELPTLALPEQPTIVLPQAEVQPPPAPEPPPVSAPELPTLALPGQPVIVQPQAELQQPPAPEAPPVSPPELPTLALPEQPTPELPSETALIDPPAPTETEPVAPKGKRGLFDRLFGSEPTESAETKKQEEPATALEETAQSEEPTLPIFTELPPVEGAEVIAVAPDEAEILETDDGKRVVVKERGRVIIKHDDNDRFRRRGEDINVEKGKNGRTITTVTRRNGSQVVTIRSASGDILQRYRKKKNGKVEILIGERDRDGRPRRGQLASPPKPDKRFDFSLALPKLKIQIPQQQYIIGSQGANRSRIEEALIAPPVEAIERPYSLVEIQRSQRLRAKLRRIDVDTVNFEFGAATIAEDQIPNLQTIGNALASIIASNPNEVFLIEGHTDAVGSNLSNLALSDRRAESIAGILAFYFNIPPENLITQGYGEQYLKILTAGPERANRRASVRRITPLLVGHL